MTLWSGQRKLQFPSVLLTEHNVITFHTDENAAKKTSNTSNHGVGRPRFISHKQIPNL